MLEKYARDNNVWRNKKRLLRKINLSRKRLSRLNRRMKSPKLLSLGIISTNRPEERQMVQREKKTK
jgi:hypothetical protein